MRQRLRHSQISPASRRRCYHQRWPSCSARNSSLETTWSRCCTQLQFKVYLLFCIYATTILQDCCQEPFVKGMPFLNLVNFAQGEAHFSECTTLTGVLFTLDTTNPDSKNQWISSRDCTRLILSRSVHIIVRKCIPFPIGFIFVYNTAEVVCWRCTVITIG